MGINFKLNKRAAVIYTLGLISGIGIVTASIVGASDSSVPYTFQDGQVISADTMNDLFGRIKMSNEGFSSVNDLNGAWSCITYDFSGQSKTNGMVGYATWSYCMYYCTNRLCYCFITQDSIYQMV